MHVCYTHISRLFLSLSPSKLLVFIFICAYVLLSLFLPLNLAANHFNSTNLSFLFCPHVGRITLTQVALYPYKHTSIHIITYTSINHFNTPYNTITPNMLPIARDPNPARIFGFSRVTLYGRRRKNQPKKSAQKEQKIFSSPHFFLPRAKRKENEKNDHSSMADDGDLEGLGLFFATREGKFERSGSFDIERMPSNFFASFISFPSLSSALSFKHTYVWVFKSIPVLTLLRGTLDTT